MKNRIIIIIACAVVFLFSCATPRGDSQRGAAKSPADLILAGTKNLILAPFQIALGLMAGIASMPYYLAMSLDQINRGMIDAQAKITLDDTYESAYGKRISQVPESGDTGDVFRRMKHASEFFQKVLGRYGVADAENYILTSIDTANNMGYTLFAVVYRPHETVTVIDKYDKTSLRSYSRADRMYYEPFEKDAKGRPLDIVVDWVGLPRDLVLTQKAQAIMITLAANSVVDRKKSPDYWDIENRWIAGEFRAIVEQKANSVKNKMNIGS